MMKSIALTHTLLVQSTLFRSAQKDWLQVMFALLAIIVGSAGLSAVLILNNAAQSEYRNMSNNALGVPYTIGGMISAKDPKQVPLTRTDYSQLRRAGHINAVAFAQFETTLTNPIDDTVVAVNIIGVDAPALALFADQVNDPIGLTESALMSPDLYAQFSSQRLALLQLENELILPDLPLFPAPTKPVNGQQILALDLYYFSQLFTPLTEPASQLLEDPIVEGDSLPFELEIAVLETPQLDIEQLKQQLPPHLQIKSLNQPIDPASITQSLHLNLLAMSVVMFAVCFFIVINALNLLILGRTQLFKTLRQLGTSRQTLITAQIIELTLYAVIGASIGVFLGHYLAVLLAPTLALTLSGLFNINLGFMQLNSLHLALPITMVCIIAMLLAAALPYQQLNRALSHKNFVLPTHDNKPNQKLWIFGVVSTLTLIAASLTLDLGSQLSLDSFVNTAPSEAFSDKLTSTFAVIAGVIVSGILGLFWVYPLVIKLLTKIAESGHPLWHWSFAHAAIVANKTKLASAAFLIALITHIGMNLMVGSFRTATSTWLEQRLVADYYVYGDSSDISIAQSRLHQQDIRTFARYQIDTQVIIQSTQNNSSADLTRPIRVYSYPHDADYQQGLFVDTISPDAWQAFKGSETVFINQQMALRHQLSINDSVILDINGLQETMQVKAIYMDYGNPYIQALVPPELFIDSLNQASAVSNRISTRVIAVHLSDTTKLNHQSTTDADKLNLQSQLPATVNLYSRDEILSASMQAFDKTFLITDALNIVTLLVAVFSLTTSIILLAHKNRYVGALLRSLGVSKTRFTIALFSQYALLCLIAAIWAIPFGIMFAWLLVNRLNVYAFQWQFPLSVDPMSIISAVSLSLLIVLVLAALPIFRRQNVSISEQLTCKE